MRKSNFMRYDDDDLYYDSDDYEQQYDNSNHDPDKLYTADDYDEENYYDDEGNVISEDEARKQCIEYILQVVGPNTYPMDIIEDIAYNHYYDKSKAVDDLLQNGLKLLEKSNQPIINGESTSSNGIKKSSSKPAEKVDSLGRPIQKKVSRDERQEIKNGSRKRQSKTASNPSSIETALSNGGGDQGKFRRQYHTYHFNNPSKFDFSTPSPDDFIGTGTSTIINAGAEVNKDFQPIVKKADAPLKKTSKETKEQKDIHVRTSQLQSESQSSSTSVGTPKRTKPKPTPTTDTAKERVNIIIIGHVDAGKSTLTGRLLYELGHIEGRELQKLQRDSSNIGKGSFAYAWILDENEEERNRGVTIEVGVKHFDTEHRHVTILDAPGHRDFIPNMITGAAQADAAVLVIDATSGGFEKGFESGGQTKEHILLARSLGISQLCVAVNKLDTLNWSEERFNEIKSRIKIFLKQAQFKEENVTYIPCSAFKGDNLYKRSDSISWYKGVSIVECIDIFQSGKRDLDKSFRLSIADICKLQNLGTTVSGRIESGYVSVGEELLVMPIGELCSVKAIRRHKQQIETAYSGDNVDLILSGITEDRLVRGQILCDPDDVPVYSDTFTAKVVTFDLENPILKGADVVLHIIQADVAAKIVKFISVLDRNGVEVKKRPRLLPSNSIVVVQIQVDTSVCLDTFENNKSFGRFLLRQSGNTIASGIITSIP